MRAHCEQCEQAQPVDWHPGDLCTHCGSAVRRDVRCFWCAKWTPFAKFCRDCGAAVVEETAYGAARMLKDAGTDRFTIPKQLAELDPDQIDNFSRIYQRHSVTVARHVDELRFVESHLRQNHWSGQLESELIPQLPWPEDVLDLYATPTDGAPSLARIQEESPFPTTRALAAIARVRLGDREPAADVEALLRGDDDVAAEAALVLGGWRSLLAGRVRDPKRLIERLRQSPMPHLAAPRLVALGAEAALDDGFDAGQADGEPDEVLEVALARGDHDVLVAALNKDEGMRIAAGVALARAGVAAPLVRPLEEGPDDVRQPILYALGRREEPFPVLRAVLLDLVETTDSDSLRERAARISCRALMSGDALRIATASRNDRSIYQSVLGAESVDQHELCQVLDHMIAQGVFAMSQYGLDDVAKSNRVDDSFVPPRFAAADSATREGLLRFAEVQLIARGSDALHRFVLDVVFSASLTHEDPIEARHDAWSCLQRYYRHGGDRRGDGPVCLTADGMELVTPIPKFADNLAAMLRDARVTDNVFLAELLATVLGNADADGAALVAAHDPSAGRLVTACVHVLSAKPRATLVDAALKFLMLIGSRKPWLREVLEGVRAAHIPGNYYFGKALETLELASHDLPPLLEWKDLPVDYVAERWEAAGAETRRQLLHLADHQIVHTRSDATEPVLMPVLLRAGLLPGDPEIQRFAAERYADRGRQRWDLSHIDSSDVSTALGGAEKFAAALPAILQNAAQRRDAPGLRMVEATLRKPSPDVVAAIAHAPTSAADIIASCVELAAVHSEDRETERLSTAAIGWLTALAVHSELTDPVRLAVTQASPPTARQPARKWEALVKSLVPGEPDVRPPIAVPRTAATDQQQAIAELTHQMQQAVAEIMAGPASPQEKASAAQRASEEFQAALQKLLAGP